MTYKLNYNPLVFDDLQDIYNYLAKENVALASNIRLDIMAKMESLCEMPNRGIKLSNKIKIAKRKKICFL